jgi:hypothetical protein
MNIQRLSAILSKIGIPLTRINKYAMKIGVRSGTRLNHLSSDAKAKYAMPECKRISPKLY